MIDIFRPTFEWIRDDWSSNKFRFIVELLAWASYTRKSFGMLANYILLTAIDTIGLIRML
jgi:hypothetical protein